MCYEDQRGPDRAFVHRGLERVEWGPGQVISEFLFVLPLVVKEDIYWMSVAPAEVTDTGWDEPVWEDRGMQDGRRNSKCKELPKATRPVITEHLRCQV